MEQLDLDIAAAVKANISVAGVIRSLGRAFVGSNYRLIKKKIVDLKLDVSHFKGVAHGTSNFKRRISWKKILVINSPYVIGFKRKARLIADGYLRNVCYECGLPPVWRERKLNLELDHRNGINSDHRIENLRLLCPNCHSQTDTYCGKNNTKYRHPKLCPVCGRKILRQSNACARCSSQRQPTKIKWPSVEEVLAMLRSQPVTGVAKILGVSDNAVRKFMIRRAGLTSAGIKNLRLRGREVEGGGL